MCTLVPRHHNINTTLYAYDHSTHAIFILLTLLLLMIFYFNGGELNYKNHQTKYKDIILDFSYFKSSEYYDNKINSSMVRNGSLRASSALTTCTLHLCNL